jgi:hypothetical protein
MREGQRLLAGRPPSKPRCDTHARILAILELVTGARLSRAGHSSRPLVDHRNLVTTSHHPGGEPEHALSDQVR